MQGFVSVRKNKRPCRRSMTALKTFSKGITNAFQYMTQPTIARKFESWPSCSRSTVIVVTPIGLTRNGSTYLPISALALLHCSSFRILHLQRASSTDLAFKWERRVTAILKMIDSAAKKLDAIYPFSPTDDAMLTRFLVGHACPRIL